MTAAILKPESYRPDFRQTAGAIPGRPAGMMSKVVTNVVNGNRLVPIQRQQTARQMMFVLSGRSLARFMMLLVP